MKEKWKDLAVSTGLTAVGTTTEAVWTGLLVWATSKIPYIGIPIATLLGVTGVVCTVYIANGGRLYLKDWKKQYYTVEQ